MKKSVVITMVCGLALAAGVVFFGKIGGNNMRSSHSTSYEVVEIKDIQQICEVRKMHDDFVEVFDQKGKPGKEKNVSKYKVSYRGNVVYGIDESVKAEVDKSNKTVKVRMPDVKVLSKSIDFDSMDYIFSKKKYEKPGVSQEAYNYCLDDFETKLQQEQDLKEKVGEDIIKLVSEYAGTMFKGYKIEFEK